MMQFDFQQFTPSNASSQHQLNDHVITKLQRSLEGVLPGARFDDLTQCNHFIGRQPRAMSRIPASHSVAAKSPPDELLSRLYSLSDLPGRNSDRNKFISRPNYK